MKYPFTLTNESITVVVDGKPRTIQQTSPQYKPLKAALQEKRWDDVPKFLTIAKTLEEWAKGKFTFAQGEFLYEGVKVAPALHQRIIAMATAGEDPQPLFNFWERLQRNPSARSVEQLWPFLQHGGIPLTPEGRFLAYKGVTNDLKDAHTGTVDNKPGVVNKLPRNQISDDFRKECHFGYHVGALSYAKTFSQRVVVCEVDPEHVVCVPYDHDYTKMRVCEYRVVGHHNGELLPSLVSDPADMPEVKQPAVQRPPLKKKPQAIKKAKPKIGPKQPKAQPVVSAKTQAAKPKAASKHTYSKLDLEELMKVPTMLLRWYAVNDLKIVGAGHIQGGKIALCQRIMQVRS